MTATTTRRMAYWLAAVLALAYVIYVVASKLLYTNSAGALGELGEFGLVLAAVIAFSIGLLADEAAQARDPH